MSEAEDFVLTSTIRCHTWNADRSQCALSPCNNEIWIYKTNGSEDTTKWERTFVLVEHDQVITGLDWAPKTNRIVSCSQDRNAYVWTYNSEADEWKPVLVLLRISRAATCCKWSPLEDKFAVGSSAKMVCVCFFEKENNWWVSKTIKKPHKSTILNVAWHPTDNTILATASSDFKCRIFCVYIKEVDGKEKKGTFGDCSAEFTSKGWVRDVAFSPSGASMAYVGHDSTLAIVDLATKKEKTVSTRDLPYLVVMFLTEKTIVTAGFNFTPIAFTLAKDGGEWSYVGHCDAKDKSKKQEQAGVRGAFNKFQQTAAIGEQNREKQGDALIKTRHHNTINQLRAFKGSAAKIDKFTSSGIDGKLFYWDVSEISKLLSFSA